MTPPTDSAGVEVTCTGIGQIYHVDGADVTALSEVNLRVEAGETVALFGPSGSGKSTLVSLLAGLRRPTFGRIRVGEAELSQLSERQLLQWRGRQIGIVVQNPSRSLLAYGTAEDNILFARRALGRRARRQLPPPITLLRQLGLQGLAGQAAGRLSGGEQQRLSVAVAMSVTPRLLLADEPTSQLDGVNRDLVVDLITRVNAEFNTTVAVVTHDPVVADATHRRITLSGGHVIDDGLVSAQPGGQW
jgi:putative ABC transport system ATP-binding protein